jgi:hypothetical protein
VVKPESVAMAQEEDEVRHVIVEIVAKEVDDPGYTAVAQEEEEAHVKGEWEGTKEETE